MIATPEGPRNRPNKTPPRSPALSQERRPPAIKLSLALETDSPGSNSRMERKTATRIAVVLASVLTLSFLAGCGGGDSAHVDKDKQAGAENKALKQADGGDQ